MADFLSPHHFAAYAPSKLDIWRALSGFRIIAAEAAPTGGNGISSKMCSNQ
jgi:hypothetical protein